MKVNIKGREIELKSTLRSYILFENIAGKDPSKIESVMDILIFFYSTLMGSARELVLSFDDFLDYCDDNPDVINTFNAWLLEQAANTEQLSNDFIAEEEKKETVDVQ